MMNCKTKSYKHLFFDLDNTFWDVEANQKAALNQLFVKYGFNTKFDSFEKFFETFHAINSELWLKYRDGVIKGEELRNNRFRDLLTTCNIEDEELALQLSSEYIRTAPTFNTLFDHSIEILEYLTKEKGYSLSLVTNGFTDVQFSKLKHSKLTHYFEHVITSEFAGVNKPAPGIFEYAMNKVGVKAREVIMIGDDPYNDIYGAQSVGIDCVYFNITGEKTQIPPTYEINSLIELKSIF